MAKSPPSTPFYWNDHYRDTRVLQPASRGVWMDLLCKLHESGRRGEVTMPLQSWLAWCGCPQEVFLSAALDIFLTQVGVVLFAGCDMSHAVTLYYSDVTVQVTVKNRRMVRERNARESDRLRQQKSRTSRSGHTPRHDAVTSVTPLPSSSFSSSPSHWEPPNPLVKGDVTASGSEVRSGGGFSKLSDAVRSIFAQHVDFPVSADDVEVGKV